MTLLRSFLVASMVLGFLVQAAAADESVYKGKQVVILVSADAGTSYDLYPRTAARHIGKYIPGNPKIVVKNMPGASGMVAANWLYNIAKKDGLTMGAIPPDAPADPGPGGETGALRSREVQLGRDAGAGDRVLLRPLGQQVQDRRRPGQCQGAGENGGHAAALRHLHRPP